MITSHCEAAQVRGLISHVSVHHRFRLPLARIERLVVRHCVPGVIYASIDRSSRSSHRGERTDAFNYSLTHSLTHSLTRRFPQPVNPVDAPVDVTVDAPEDAVEEAEEDDQRAEIVVQTAPIDPRFPATNQARHCFVKYNEAHKCNAEKGEDDETCQRLSKAYRSICPVEWLEKWNEARDAGEWWGKY